MNYQNKNITSDILFDNLFINFPLWFPIGYIFLAINIPKYNPLLFIVVLFLFAETHFASTWLFFFDKKNLGWFKNNYYQIFLLPIYCAFLIIFTWFFSPSLVLVLHYLASGWHVTKQSIGILKIYGASQKIYKFLVYIFSFTCLGVGLKNPGIITTNLDKNYINFILIFLIILYASILLLSKYGYLSKNVSLLFPLLTGILIYLPILFFDNLAIATAIGVGMHWCQYIAIMWSIHLRKNRNLISDKRLSKRKNHSVILFVFLYSLIMTGLAVKGMPDFNIKESQYSYFYLIPLLFQLYHFYIDGFIWKFSDPHIKKNVLPFIFKKL